MVYMLLVVCSMTYYGRLPLGYRLPLVLAESPLLR
jgi:hypothetical protein